jgi:hypothetical protein
MKLGSPLGEWPRIRPPWGAQGRIQSMLRLGTALHSHSSGLLIHRSGCSHVCSGFKVEMEFGGQDSGVSRSGKVHSERSIRSIRLWGWWNGIRTTQRIVFTGPGREILKYLDRGFWRHAACRSETCSARRRSRFLVKNDREENPHSILSKRFAVCDGLAL